MARKIAHASGEQLYLCHVQPREIMQVFKDTDHDVAFCLYTEESEINTVYVKISELPRLIDQLTKIALTHLIAPDEN